MVSFCGVFNSIVNLLLVSSFNILSLVASSEDFYSHTVKDIKGNDVSLEKYRGKVSLVVNVASECGFTERHYSGLVKAQDILGKDGKFVVLAFPCNQFGAQEPAENKEILKWAKDNYKINFPLFAKVNVIEDFVPDVWRYIVRESGLAPNWNFWKFLVDHNGKVLNGWGPWSDIEEIFPDVKAAVDKAPEVKSEDNDSTQTEGDNEEDSDDHSKTVKVTMQDHVEL